MDIPATNVERSHKKVSNALFKIGVLASSILIPWSPWSPWSPSPSPSIVQADSTGKFSTKMTAKKRYLPRIQSGVTKFNSIINTDNDIDAFISDDLDKLLRAMDLYGASLRRGETPDEISRTATKLTEEFGRKMAQLRREKSAENKTVARNALDNYLTFAKLNTSLSKNPAEQVQ